MTTTWSTPLIDDRLVVRGAGSGVGRGVALELAERLLLAVELDGVAVALTSSVAHRGTPGVAHSSASKSDIEGFVRSAACEWGKLGVRMNVVGPSRFPVEKSKDMCEKFPGGKEGLRLPSGDHEPRRPTTTVDVAKGPR